MPRKILIIGNSDGIGAATTRALIAKGDTVVGISRSPSPLGDHGPRHVVQDVADPEYPGVLGRVMKEEGPFDACLYCVGIGSRLTLPDMSNESRVIEVNFTAMVRTLAVLIPEWMPRHQGHFIGLSSLADEIYNRDSPSYTASKAGFSHYLISMALGLGPHGIHLTNVRFGYVDTKLPKSTWKPFMISSDQAAIHLLHCLETKPIQLSVPKITGACVRVLRWLQSVRVWIS